MDFNRPIPLFPLPNCVLFPGVVQPLHIFEPRYRDMIADALNDQSALAIALLKPGWEKNYYGSPDLHPTLCTGTILAHERLPDGKYNLLLHGVSRARILSHERRGLYRVAHLEPLPDLPVPPPLAPNETLQRKVIRELFRKTPLKDLTIVPTLSTLFDDTVPLSRMIDSLAFTLVQDVTAKQSLLEQPDPLQRGELLLQNLVALAAQLSAQTPPKSSTWPPSINVN